MMIQSVKNSDATPKDQSKGIIKSEKHGRPVEQWDMTSLITPASVYIKLAVHRKVETPHTLYY